jgi:hypothetical protein
MVKGEILYITFYECSNRVAKYLEQLFLDIYDFYHNKEDNIGSKYLKTIWRDDRVVNGTQLHEQAEMMVKKNSGYFNP